MMGWCASDMQVFLAVVVLAFVSVCDIVPVGCSCLCVSVDSHALVHATCECDCECACASFMYLCMPLCVKQCKWLSVSESVHECMSV